MICLGLETSCDETGAAVVAADRRILSNRIAGQDAVHRPFGGVVPEIAAREHLIALDPLIRDALTEADIALSEVDLIAATGGPGLIGGVLIGATMAKAIAFAAGKPFLAVNHLEGHALSPRLTEDVDFPYLLLLISGGHCQLLAVEGPGRYRRYGTTLDDAAGEAFDKVAKVLGLGYPGGPAIEKIAGSGDSARFALPQPMKGQAHCDFSFSGLKTAVIRKAGAITDARDRADMAAGFQAAVAASLADRTAHAIARFRTEFPNGRHLVAAGGVAANAAIRHKLEGLAVETGLAFAAPPLALCTDNAAMIAWAGLELFATGRTSPLDFRPRPRWPLDETAPRRPGAGVKA